MTTKRERSDPNRVTVCPVCRELMPLGKRSAHLAESHPGWRLERKGWQLRVISPEGAETVLSSVELGAIRRAAIDAAAGPRAEPPDPGPAASPPASAGPGPTIDETRRPFAWQAPASPPVVSRQAIADALSEAMLADMLRQFSATLSEWDGAGEAGTLSRIEAAQLASLFYDSTLGLIERYFRGNVDRFRLSIGLAILLLGKGRIHARAIAARRASRTSGSRAAAADAALRELAAADEPLAFAPAEDDDAESDEPEPEPQYASTAEIIAARQRAWREANPDAGA